MKLKGKVKRLKNVKIYTKILLTEMVNQMIVSRPVNRVNYLPFGFRTSSNLLKGSPEHQCFMVSTPTWVRTNWDRKVVTVCVENKILQEAYIDK